MTYHTGETAPSRLQGGQAWRFRKATAGALTGLSRAWQAQEVLNQTEWKHSVRMEISSCGGSLLPLAGAAKKQGANLRLPNCCPKHNSTKSLPPVREGWGSRGNHLGLPGAMESRALST